MANKGSGGGESEQPHEPKIAAGEIAPFIETIRRVLDNAHPLADKIRQSDNPDLKEQGWGATWGPTESSHDHWAGLIRVGLWAAHNPSDNYRGATFARGPRGENMYINAYTQEDGTPNSVYHLQGASKEGKFSLSYLYDKNPATYPYEKAGVTCTLPSGEFYFFMRDRRGEAPDDITFKVIPLPLGQLDFVWQEEMAPDVGVGGVIKIDKEHLEVGFANHVLGRGRLRIRGFDDVLSWYKGLDIAGKDPAALEKWFRELPAEVNIRDMLAQAEAQAQQAIETLLELSDDLSTGWQMTPEVWKREEFRKYNAAFLD